MQTKQLIRLAMCALPLCVCACSDNNDQPDGGDKTTPPTSACQLVVLNEGTWGQNNSNISITDFTGQNQCQQVFYHANNRYLGDLGHDIVAGADNQGYYICMSGSNCLYRTDADMRMLSNVDFYSQPALQGGARNVLSATDGVYVTFGGGYVAKYFHDLSQQTGISRPSDYNLEGIAELNGVIYIAESYKMGTDASGNTTYIYGNTLLKVDPATMQPVGTVTVPLNPNIVTAGPDGKLYIVSYGNYYDIPSLAAQYDPATDRVTVIGAASHIAVGNTCVYLDDCVYNYATGQVTNTFSWYDMQTSAMHSDSFLTDAPQDMTEVNVSAMAENPCNGDICIATTKFGNAQGEIWVFDHAGNFKNSFRTGGYHPLKILFRCNDTSATY